MSAEAAPPVDAIRLTPHDTVATVLRPVIAGEHVRVRCGTEVVPTLATEAVPLCHKLSLVAHLPGEPVRKYGEVIGEATMPIAPGAHVHVHNMRSRRGRGPAG
jgi:altronate dehydratase